MQEYELKNWEIRKRGQWPTAYGNVYGNPGFHDGYWIHTSSLMGYEETEDALYLRTCHSTYRCRKENFGLGSSKKMLEWFLSSCGGSEEFCSRLLEEIKEKAEKAKKKEEELDARRKKENCAILLLDAIDAWYFGGIEVHLDGQVIMTRQMKLHAGREHRMVLAVAHDHSRIDPRLQGIEFGWYPLEGNKVLFCSWPTGKMHVYLKNKGDQSLELDTPYGQFNVPGGVMIRPDARNEEYRLVP